MQSKVYQILSGLLFLLGFMPSSLVSAQSDCISAPSSLCLNDCSAVTYIGSASPTLNYTWSSTCATIENPNQMDPGLICFTTPGICTINVHIETVGGPSEDCSIDVEVFALPEAMLSGNQTICEGACANLTINLSGTAPFTFGLLTPNGIETYTTSLINFEVEVCPDSSTTYSIDFVSDLECNNNVFASNATVDVLPNVAGSVVISGNTICAFPLGSTYSWYDCAGGNPLSTDSCYTPSQSGCYCVIIGSICQDTICTDIIICDLTCGISGPDSICSGEIATFAYNGNAGPDATFSWLYDVDGQVGVTGTGNPIAITYISPGCYPIEVTVSDQGCVETCYDTICISIPSSVEVCCPKEVCDTCTTISILLNGQGPWDLVIDNGTTIDTLIGITQSNLNYQVCSLVDTTLIVTILSASNTTEVCPPSISGNNVAVTFNLPFDGEVTEIGAALCASPGDADSYTWFACGDTIPLANAACFNPPAAGCYCVEIRNGLCTDTVCTDFVGCQLTCGINGIGNYCIGDLILLTTNSNAGDSAVIKWAIDVDNNPGLHFIGDSVELEYNLPGCYQVTLSIQEDNCIVTCSDSICISARPEVEICCDYTGCDTCAPLVFQFSGAGPFTIILTDGTSNDTITGITSNTYTHLVCPAAETVATYSIVAAWDSANICAADVLGGPVTIQLHQRPVVQIVQSGDTLCALPTNMAGYGWYSCPTGAYLSTSDCFIPTVDGCYCVDVSSQFGCVDTACVDFLLGTNGGYYAQGLWYYGQNLIKHSGIKVSKIGSFRLFDMFGRQIPTQNQDATYSVSYKITQAIVPGIYLIIWEEKGRQSVQKIWLAE